MNFPDFPHTLMQCLFTAGLTGFAFLPAHAQPTGGGSLLPPPAVMGAVPAAAEAGPRIMAEAFSRLGAALTESLAKHGPAKSLEVCSVEAPRIAAEVSKRHGVTVRRASGKPRNPRNLADEAERAILSTFGEALAKGISPKPLAVTRPDGQVDFFAPILIASPVCLQCHGRPGQDITPETTAAINQRYPEDKATGYRSGELRGLWKITFPAAP